MHSAHAAAVNYSASVVNCVAEAFSTLLILRFEFVVHRCLEGTVLEVWWLQSWLALVSPLPWSIAWRETESEKLCPGKGLHPLGCTRGRWLWTQSRKFPSHWSRRRVWATIPGNSPLPSSRRSMYLGCQWVSVCSNIVFKAYSWFSVRAEVV